MERSYCFHSLIQNQCGSLRVEQHRLAWWAFEQGFSPLSGEITKTSEETSLCLINETRLSVLKFPQPLMGAEDESLAVVHQDLVQWFNLRAWLLVNGPSQDPKRLQNNLWFTPPCKDCCPVWFLFTLLAAIQQGQGQVSCIWTANHTYWATVALFMIFIHNSDNECRS